MINYYFHISSKDSLAKNVKVPKDILTTKFTPWTVSLNNKVVFVATGTGITEHKGGKRGCSLGPCRIMWDKGDKIAKVRVLLGNPVQLNTEIWVCAHHQRASLDGFSLQKQSYAKKTKKQEDTEPSQK